jgi:hypothetical protein
MKWPSLAAHPRASLADALATVTPALIRKDARSRPGPRELRTALYQHAFKAGGSVPYRKARCGSRCLDFRGCGGDAAHDWGGNLRADLIELGLQAACCWCGHVVISCFWLLADWS